MSFKITIIGAGSYSFARNLVQDILCVPEFKNIEIVFYDINEKKMERTRVLCQRDIDENKLHITIKTTTNRKEALTGARYVFCIAWFGGIEALRPETEIPLKYGVDQAIGEIICPSGIMGGQRSIPPILEICRDIKEVSLPGCLQVAPLSATPT